MTWRFLPAVDLESASLSFTLPARTRLQRGGPGGVASVVTSDKSQATTIRLTLGPTLFRMVFEPHLVIDLPAPLGDMGLQGMDLDFRTGVITPNVWQLPGFGIPVGKEQALEQARAWMRDLLTATPLRIAPYDPSADRDLVLSFQQVLANLESGGGESTALARDVCLSAKLTVREELAADVGPGGFRVPAGAVVQLKVDFAGKPTEVQLAPKVLQAVVECSSVVLRKDGADQAEVGRFRLRPGGAITVEQVRPLGEAGQLAGLESLVRLIGALSTRGSLGLDPATIGPEAVERLVKEEIEAALGPALHLWVEENAASVAGLDLKSVLGMA
ncbi:hypothetical protein [Chondromyces crocatus]|uniref:Uncharacterized protein n=1 Tax=Chondromyces crocatus TaxID=52 RepID=A0A0K1ESN0_CHOCO|nr:hypothetical protein [Chondromyces crocatus]AKT43809.1 uncharacterized protein CMC5_080460 [Chondromyces crocatus]